MPIGTGDPSNLRYNFAAALELEKASEIAIAAADAEKVRLKAAYDAANASQHKGNNIQKDSSGGSRHKF